MATLHVCDGCGDEFMDKSRISKISIKKGEKFELGKTVASHEFCEDCEPGDLVDALIARLNLWPDE